MTEAPMPYPTIYPSFFKPERMPSYKYRNCRYPIKLHSVFKFQNANLKYKTLYYNRPGSDAIGYKYRVSPYLKVLITKNAWSFWIKGGNGFRFNIKNNGICIFQKTKINDFNARGCIVIKDGLKAITTLSNDICGTGFIFEKNENYNESEFYIMKIGKLSYGVRCSLFDRFDCFLCWNGEQMHLFTSFQFIPDEEESTIDVLCQVQTRVNIDKAKLLYSQFESIFYSSKIKFNINNNFFNMPSIKMEGDNFGIRNISFKNNILFNNLGRLGLELNYDKNGIKMGCSIDIDCNFKN